MDSAVWLWFLQKDPLSIHVLILAAYQCLEDLGKKAGKGPHLKAAVEDFTLAYDFLRHASNNPNAGIIFTPIMNAPILFDAVAAFDRIFDKLTMYMRTFRGYFILRPEPPPPNPDFRKRLLKYATEFLPEGITVEEAEKLGRMEFFTKLTEMFAAQYRA